MSCKPTEKQLKFLDWEFGAFFHFGIRSFNPGHCDWDGKPMPLDTFNPDDLDCDKWISLIKEAGAKYAILTTKHHDGFANWPTAYNDYSVANTPWKNGKGDVVREFVEACRKHDIGVGLYYSPAQWQGSVEFKDGKEYDDYFINQITELLTNYGKIDYLWFDGCGSAGHVYDQKRIISVIRSLQPEILIFGMWDPDTTWVGNEDGYATIPNPYTKTCTFLGEKRESFMPYECDCKIRETWFYDINEFTLKPLEELIGMYEMSVGRGANLLLNMSPDNHGRIPNADAQRLLELGEEIRRRYSHPLNFTDIKKVAPGKYEIEFDPENRLLLTEHIYMKHVRAAVIEEDITNGEQVLDFKLSAEIPNVFRNTGISFVVCRAETIGHKHICRFPAIRSVKFILEILRCSGDLDDVRIKSLKVYS